MKVGDYVELHILDHAQGMKELVNCFVSGKIVELDEQKVVLCYWTIQDEDDELVENNEEHLVLIRVGIAKWRRVLKWSPWKVEALSISNQ